MSGRTTLIPGALAIGILALESMSSAVGSPQQALAGLSLVVAPGLAALPLLPPELRRLPVTVAVVPIVGVVLSEVALVTFASVGGPLDDTGVRAVLWAIVLVATVVTAVVERGPSVTDVGAAGPVLAALGAVLALGAWLQALVIGGKPLPGEDWGEYLLYAQQIDRQHSLLIENPYWMLGGQTFPLDPGIPSLYGAFLTLSNASPTALLHGIWLFALLAILAVFVFTTALWGPVAGIVAAAVFAAVPMNLNILAWHALPNVAALALVPIALLATGFWLRGHGTRRWAALLALSLVGLAATHRLSFVLSVVAILFSTAAGFAFTPRPRLRFVGWTLVACVVMGTGVAVDLVRRNDALGGLQGYEAYLTTKVAWNLVARDLTWVVALAGLAALVVATALRPFWQDRARLTLLGAAAAIVSLSYAWVVHVPMGYNRPAYFAPLVLAPALGLVASRVPTVPALAAAVVLVALAGWRAHDLGPAYRGFYGHVNEASLRGLGLVSQRARPGEAVVTDQCWSFLSTWLLQRPVLAALDPALIFPSREVAPASRARRMLTSRRGAELARSAGIRFALVDPQCTYQSGRRFPTPRSGTLVYASTRLLVFEFPRRARSG